MDLKKQIRGGFFRDLSPGKEKDHLAQLLEEKDLLQKAQIEKIQNLTWMLVTCSSLVSQELKG